MKLRYKLLFIAVALVGLSSCSDFLETIPDTRVYLQNLDQLEQLLVSGYTQNSYAPVGELSSDNVDDSNSPDAQGMRYNYSTYHRYDEQIYAWQDVDLDISDEDSPSGIWNGCYSAIAHANAVIEKVDEFEASGEIEGHEMTTRDKARLAAIKGEAHMIRAYHHYILAQIFCMPYRGPQISTTLPGIPYAKEVETRLDPKYDRGTLEETYQNIEADLLIGLANVADEFYDVPKYHFNIASSNAFAARFYLAKREYDKVVQYATAAFKGNDPPPCVTTSGTWARNSTTSMRVHVTTPALSVPVTSCSLTPIAPGCVVGATASGLPVTVSLPAFRVLVRPGRVRASCLA